MALLEPDLFGDVPGLSPARVLLTGSRTWTVASRIRAGLLWAHARWPDAVLVHGDHWAGADRIASAMWRSWGLPDEPHPADWDAHGRPAGPRRNLRMVKLGAVVCLAFIRDHSPGAEGCADAAQAAGIWTIRDRRHYRA